MSSIPTKRALVSHSGTTRRLTDMLTFALPPPPLDCLALLLTRGPPSTCPSRTRPVPAHMPDRNKIPSISRRAHHHQTANGKLGPRGSTMGLLARDARLHEESRPKCLRALRSVCKSRFGPCQTPARHIALGSADADSGSAECSRASLFRKYAHIPSTPYNFEVSLRS